jgi:hypothetical protein
MSLDAALEAIYASLKDDNNEIDSHIARLKAAMAASGQKKAVLDPQKIAQNNRQGRKTLQAYFRQRGVAVEFSG